MEALFASLGERWDGLDGIVHAIAFAPREALAGDFHEAVTRESFRIAHDVSSYSLAALAKAGLQMMEGRADFLAEYVWIRTGARARSSRSRTSARCAPCRTTT